MHKLLHSWMCKPKFSIVDFESLGCKLINKTNDCKNLYESRAILHDLNSIICLRQNNV